MSTAASGLAPARVNPQRKIKIKIKIKISEVRWIKMSSDSAEIPWVFFSIAALNRPGSHRSVLRPFHPHSAPHIMSTASVFIQYKTAG